MPKPPLRVVGPQKPTTRYHSVSSALKSGTYRDVLAAQARLLTGLIDDPDTEARSISPLMRRLQEVLRDLEALDAAAEQEAAERKPVTDERWTGAI